MMKGLISYIRVQNMSESITSTPLLAECISVSTPLRIQFCGLLLMQHAAGQLLSSFRATVCGHTKCVLRVTFCSSSTAATRGKRTILVLSTNLCTDVWRLSSWTLSSNPIYYLMVWLLQHCHSLATVLPYMFKETHASVLWADIEVSALWMYPAVFESDGFCRI
jgi:hypothetical protein